LKNVKFCLFAVLLILANLVARGDLAPAAGPQTFASDDAFLDYVERQTFNFFWNEVNLSNGLIRDKSAVGWPCAIGGAGFGLGAIDIAIERGWITRSSGAERVLTTLQTLYNLPQGAGASGYAGYHGWFYHLLDANTGLRAGASELSTIDTALLMLGVIDAGQFFDNPTNIVEIQIRQFSAALLDRIDWSFALRASDNTVTLQWTPEGGFGASGWTGYNEAACLYLLGLGAATNPLPAASWSAWTNGYLWSTFYGCSYVTCAPLFTHQYSQTWIDFRGIADGYMRQRNSDYFENSRRATLAQQQYAIQNPLGYPNYGPYEWGLTACDGPDRTVNGIAYLYYAARGAPVGFDDGTIAPTAAGASLPFAPEICLPALRHLYDTYTTNIWTTEGFRDAYNIQAGNWFDDVAIGLDQGPLLIMIENYRTGSTWSRMLGSPILQRGLQRAGFTAPPPDRLQATGVSSNQILLGWRDRAAFETGFQVEASTDGVNFATAAIVGAGLTNAAVSAVVGATNYYRVRTTSTAGLSGYREILAAWSSPVVSLSSPADGAAFTAPATISLGATVVTNGSTINQVLFYANGTNLLGEGATPPYACTWTNVSAGNYQVSARVIYDATNALDSGPITIFVSVAGSPAAPLTVLATVVASNRIDLGWPPVSGSTGYALSRGGVVIATLAGTNYSDTGLTAGVAYSYTVSATNSLGSSAPSAPADATTPIQGATLAWDANAVVSGPQDGSGVWGGGGANWWVGGNTIRWFDGNVAAFGTDTVTSLAVCLAADVMPLGITFNGTSGSYTLAAGAGSIRLTNTMTLTANGNAMISAPLTGRGGLAKLGSGLLALTGDSTYSGATSLGAGTLALSGKAALGNSPALVITSGTLSLRGVTIASSITIKGGAVEYLGGFGSNILSGPITLAAPSVTFNSSWTEGWLSINGGVTGSNNNLELLNDGAVANIWICQRPLNLGGGQLNGYGWHLAVAGNIVGAIHPYYGRSTYLEVDGAFVGAPNLVVGNPSWGQLDLNGHSLTVSGLTNPANNGPSDVVRSDLPATLTVSNTTSSAYGGSLSGAGLALVKAGAGTLTLSGSSVHCGSTAVTGGTLALAAPVGITSALPNSPAISVGSGATLDLAAVAGGFTLATGQTLQGHGAVTGNCTVGSGATLAPGNAAGALAFNNALTLSAGSTTVIAVNHSPLTNDLVRVSGSLVYGGTLIVTNIGATLLAGGDSFHLFSAGTCSGYFSSILPPTPGRGLVWDTNLLADGGILKALSIVPSFSSLQLQGTNLVVTGLGGLPNASYVELTSTTADLPLSRWMRLATNYYDGTGRFVFTNAIDFDVHSPPRFFRLQVP
jgi:autotransporter-associated beta strand protein